MTTDKLDTAVTISDPQFVELHIVFQDDGGPANLRFVEVETLDRKSVRAGTWMKRDDGYDVLALSVHKSDLPALAASLPSAAGTFSDEMVERFCEAMAITIARQDGVTLTPAGYRKGRDERPEQHKQMQEYVRAGLAASLPSTGEPVEAEPAASSVKRWLVEETLPSGSIRWQCIEHEYQARSVAEKLGATVTPLYTAPLAVDQAMQDVAAERRRQIDSEGWTPEHDDLHSRAPLATAAACYAIHDSHLGSELPIFWPWEMSWWKPTDRRRDLVKAGALILAEIERLDRAALKQEGSK